ncbi:hypothetical protein [Terriglobus sp. ADX1]|uniref:hypothetical protein n=1 Tax=Terriglobus sp. ADX1 TaxID=2794063 RepID=UPI002FE5893B
MFKFIAVALFAFTMSAFAAEKIPSGSKIYIEPMEGFETSVTAAIIKKDVPVKIVDAKEKADYILSGTSSLEKAGWAKTIFVSPKAAAHAAVQLKTTDGTLIWAYSVDKGSAYHGEQSTAEAIAKHMKGEAVAEAKK